MTTSDKILEFVYTKRHELESDWTQDLEDMNIYEDVMAIYTAPGVEGDTRIGNTILCFTVLAYNNKSSFLDPHKNRWENKQKIMVTLAGISCMAFVSGKDKVPIYVKAIDNTHKESFALAEWYIKEQTNWRWTTIIAAMEYHSMAINMSNRGAVDAQEAIQIGKMLGIAREERAQADKMMDELRTEFLSLDTALEKEHRAKITDLESLNFMSFESYLSAKQKRLAEAR